MKKKRVLIVNTLYHPYKVGGAENSVRLLAEELEKKNINVFVVTLVKGKSQVQILNGVTIIGLRLFNIYWPFDSRDSGLIKKCVWHLIDFFNIVMFVKVYSIVRKVKPDVLHFNNLCGFSLSLWWLKYFFQSINFVHTLRDYYVLSPNVTLYSKGKFTNLDSLFHEGIGVFRKCWSRNIDSVVGISDYILKKHLSYGYFKNAKQVTIFNQVEPYVSSRKLSVEKPVIGYIGKLTEHKGFLNYCFISENLKKENFTFIAAGSFGSGTGRVEYERIAKKSNVNIIGFVSLESFLEQVDCVILPVRWEEPFGRTVVECALSGKLVYVNTKGGIAELIPLFDNVYKLESEADIRLSLKKNLAKQPEYKFYKNQHLFSSAYVVDCYLKAYGFKSSTE